MRTPIGTVNTLDFNALATHFGASGAGVGGGDFNLDGTVDTSDFNSLATQWATTLPAAPLASPLQSSGLFSDGRPRLGICPPSSILKRISEFTGYNARLFMGEMHARSPRQPRLSRH